jgi:hypothetical protein
MPGLYKSEKDQIGDVILANSIKVFSVGVKGELVPASKLEIHLHREEKAAATARLAVHKIMTE